MKNALIATLGCALLTGAANANVVISFPGTYSYTGSHGTTVTTGALNGTLTGIKVQFTYQYGSGSSWAQDVAFTVDSYQWGGYMPFINGASLGASQTTAPSESGAITFVSPNLGIGYPVEYTNRCAVVGFGNANLGGGCTISNVTVTLLGVVPTPGAGAAMLIGGAAGLRRRRR